MFERARQNAFEEFMSKQVKGISFAELIGSFTDKILKKGSKISEQEQEEMIKKVVALFTHLGDKDVFIEVYRNLLARRLLNEKCESIDLEKMMITQIKLTCGANMTKRCEGMLSDLVIAENEFRKYTDFMETKEPLDIEFKVSVLTMGYWPSYKKYEL